MIRRLNPLYALLPLTLFLGACTTDSDESVTPITDPDAGTGFVATFKPDIALMPFPTDAWRNGSTDGTLNIHEFESDPLILHVQQMNMLDGFGLNSEIWADFSDPIDEESLVLGETVHVFTVAVGGTPLTVPTSASQLFTVGTGDFQGGRSVVELEPVAPLDPMTTYAVFLTAGIQSADGTAASADTAFQAMLNAYPGDLSSGSANVDAIYAGMVKSLLDLATGAGIGAENVINAWTFTTQSIGNSLDIIAATATAQGSAFAPLLRNPEAPAEGIYTAGELLMPASDANGDGTPDTGLNADVYAGVIEMPYYTDPANALTGHWQPVEASCQTAIDAELISEASASTTAFCPQPEVQATISVPVLVTVPNAANTSCDINADTVPEIMGITVFQHGITQNRTNLLPIAGALATVCHAGIAIDLPLHGITDTANPLYGSVENALYAQIAAAAPELGAALTEQTFDLDVDEDGEIDASGEYFINLESPITARDALRQAAANLIYLTRTIPTIDYNIALGAAGADFAVNPLSPAEPMPIRFVGHSLGGITGTVYLGVDATADAAVLAAPGGDIADLILESESIYPQVEAGLVEAGLTPGTRLFDMFFRNAQTLVEGGDPINYAAAANDNHNILMQEIVGGAGNSPDQVVPNTATAKLAAAMGLDVVTTNTVDPAGVDGLVQFTAGDHGSILDPSASLEATTEMQTEAAVFIGGNPLIPAPAGGAAILISDPSVIAQ